MKHYKLVVAAFAAATLSQGCSSIKHASNQDKGVAVGAGGGAVVGGVIGRATGNTALGAILGAAVGGVTGGVIGHHMDKQAQEIQQQVPGVKVQRVGEGIVVEFSAAVLFSTGQSSLSSASYSTLNNLVAILNRYPDTNLEIDGYTDNVGTVAFNQTLSEQRASSVASYLQSQNVAGNRIATRGFGEMNPKYDNTTDAGRTGNRRVEFQITANDQMKAEAAREAKN